MSNATLHILRLLTLLTQVSHPQWFRCEQFTLFQYVQVHVYACSFYNDADAIYNIMNGVYNKVIYFETKTFIVHLSTQTFFFQYYNFLDVVWHIMESLPYSPGYKFWKILTLEMDLSSTITLVTIVFSMLKITKGLKIFWETGPSIFLSAVPCVQTCLGFLAIILFLYLSLCCAAVKIYGTNI